MTQMPKYRCHKEVWALKIKGIIPFDHPRCEYKYQPGGAICGFGPNDRIHTLSTDSVIPPLGRHDYAPLVPPKEGEQAIGAIIQPEDASYGEFPVPHVYIDKHKPSVGGYYVVYADGYTSFSPADAFENGYTRI